MGTSHEGQHVEQQTSFEGSTHSTVVPTKPAGILERSLSAKREARPDGKVVLEEEDCYTKLGFCFSPAKKWTILSVIFIVQVSMNLNSSMIANAIPGITDEFGVSAQAARVGQAVFLIAYAFGCELWAPWSEELGRKPILQASLFLVNVWQVLCALSPNYGSLIVGRFLGGLSSAGGSVTLGMIADMWDAEHQQFAVSFIVLSSVGGSVVGPVVGGFIQEPLSWRWNFWIQLLFGAFTQLLHLFLVPETCAKVLTDREARRRRKAGESNIYGPLEVEENRFAPKKILTIWARPFIMYATEPIVLFLSLLSGLSDSLIFTFLESYGLIFAQWNFSVRAIGLAFTPLLVGYVIAYLVSFPDIYRQLKNRRRNPDTPPEDRLWLLLWIVPLEAIGLLGFAWTSLGPEYGIPWIAPLIFSVLIAIANFSIYLYTVDYLIAAYGPYAASATGGNGFSRDFLAGCAAMYSTPFYENIPGRYSLAWPSTILAVIAAFLAIPVFVFYFKGEYFRSRSKFAMSLSKDMAQKRPVDDEKKTPSSSNQGSEKV